MKSLKILFSILLLAVVFSSCSNDDNRLATVKYQIVGLDSSISQIKYNGSTSAITIINPNDFADGSDTKKIPINFLPFLTKLEVTATNTTSAVKHYVLAIYVDNVSSASYNLDVPANSTASGETSFNILAN